MSVPIRALPQRVTLKLRANTVETVNLDTDTPARGMRVQNFTTTDVYWDIASTVHIPTAKGRIRPNLAAGEFRTVDISAGVWTLAFISATAGDLEIDLAAEPFQPESVGQALGEFEEASTDLLQSINDLLTSQQDTLNYLQQASTSASVAFANGTGVRTVTLFGVNPGDVYLIYSIFHGYDRADTGQAGQISVARPTGASPVQFYWGSPGGGSNAPVLHKDFIFPPWREDVNGRSIVITARTPNVVTVIQTLVVFYRYVPAADGFP